MRDWNVKIGGGSGNSKQSIVFNVHYAGSSTDALQPSQILKLLADFRAELSNMQLPTENSRRIERSLATIEEETKATKPSLKDIEGSLGSISRILETATNIAPKVVSIFRGLAAALGFAL